MFNLFGPRDEQDGYSDGFFWQPADNDRGEGQDDYDNGYIEGSSDYLDNTSNHTDA